VRIKCGDFPTAISNIEETTKSRFFLLSAIWQVCTILQDTARNNIAGWVLQSVEQNGR
jgi:hypothetical protein